MSDVIRDVLIRVGIQKSQDLEPPDIREAKQRIDELKTAVDGMSQSFQQMAKGGLASVQDAIRRETEKAATAMEKASEVASQHTKDTDKQEQAVATLMETVMQHARAIDELRKQEVQLVREEKRYAELLKEQQRLTKARDDAMRDGKQAINDTVDGFGRLARAAVLLYASDKDAEEFLKIFAEFQGAFDIVRGLDDVMKGLTGTVQYLGRMKELNALHDLVTDQMQMAQTADTAAKGLKSIAKEAGNLGPAAASAGGGLSNLTTILNPYTAAIAVAVGETVLLKNALDELRESQDAVREASSTASVQERLTRVGLGYDSHQALAQQQVLEFRNHLDPAAAKDFDTRETAARLDDMNRLSRMQFLEGEPLANALDDEISQARERAAELQEMFDKQAEAISTIASARVDGVATVLSDSQRTGLKGAANYYLGPYTENLFGKKAADFVPDAPLGDVGNAFHKEIGQQNALPLLQAASKELERALSLTQDQYGVRKDLIEAAKRELETHKEALQTEHDRLEVLKERYAEQGRQLGRTSEEDIAAGRVVEAKIAAGKELTKEDIAVADRLSYGDRSEIIEREAARLRQESGIDDVRSGLGFSSPEEAANEAERRQREINEKLAGANGKLEEAKNAELDLLTRTVGIIETLNKDRAALEQRIFAIEETTRALNLQ